MMMWSAPWWRSGCWHSPGKIPFSPTSSARSRPRYPALALSLPLEPQPRPLASQQGHVSPACVLQHKSCFLLPVGACPWGPSVSCFCPFLCVCSPRFLPQDHLFFVMEFLNGGDLMYHIQDKGRFELYRATYVTALWGERAHCRSALCSFFLCLEKPA